MKKIVHLFFISVLTVLLASCPPPIDQLAIDEMLDETPPQLSVTSPSDSSEYTQNVVVTGTATDGNGKISSVEYQVSGTLGNLFSGSIPGEQLGGGGAFSFNFPTVAYDGPIVISITAEDWNDNIAEALVTLQDPGSPVSSLAALPDNKDIALSWDSVEGAQDYTIFYTTNGTLPSESYGQSITIAGTSHLLTNLENGDLHIFLLRANLTGTSYWSDYVSAIPLSQLTLAPMVTGGYGEIRLEWDSIEATDEFQVLRAENLSGPFSDYSGLVRGNEYVDTGVEPGSWYYYKVRPNLEGSIVSHANGAQTFQFPDSPEEAISQLTVSGSVLKAKYPDWGGNFVFLAAGATGFLVVDISAPDTPQIVATLSTTDARDLDLYDHGGGVRYAYIADGTGKIRAVDISDPPNPVLAGTYGGTLGEATVVVAEAGQDKLYAIDSSGNTRILALDISGESTMSLIDDIAGGASLHFSDLDVSTYSSGLHFLYATSTERDTLYEYYLSSTTLYSYRSYTDPGYLADFVEVKGSNVYVLGNAIAYLEPPPPYAVMALSKYPSSLAKVGETTFSNGFISDITSFGDKLFLADGIGLQVVDISTPASPVLTDFWNTPGSSEGVATDGDHAFIASGTLGFQTVDLSLPNALNIHGSYDPGHGYSGLAVRGDTVYATDSTAGLQLIDISDPSSPVPVPGGSLSLSSAGSIYLSGPYAFISRGTSGLAVVDISDSSSLTLVGTASVLSGSVGRLTVKGDFAYLAGSTGLQIYDISNPAAPFGMGFYDTDGGGMKDIIIREQTAFVAQGAYFQPNNLTILDISDPEIPVLEGKSSFGITVTSLSIAGDYAFVGNNFPGGGVYAVNISESNFDYLSDYGPCEPLNDGTGLITDVAAFGDFLYMTDIEGGLMVIDISDPDSLGHSDFLRSLDWTDSNPVRIKLDGRYALVADSSDGLKVIQLF